MPSLADCFKKLKASLELRDPDSNVLQNRLTPVVILEDFTRDFEATQRYVRPWSTGRSSGAVVNRAQVQIQVPTDADVISIIDHLILGAPSSDCQVEVAFRARGTAALGSIVPALYRDRRGQAFTATLEETTTVVSIADAAAVALSESMFMRIDSVESAQVYPVGIILDPGSVLMIQTQANGQPLEWTVLGRERPTDRPGG